MRETACLLLVGVMWIFGCVTSGPRAAGGEKQAADVHAWRRYTNVRFQYSICYPADLLAPQGEPDNSDGQIFLAADGARLSVFGSYNAERQPLKEIMQETSSRHAGKSGKVTYRLIKPNWFVVSGVNESSVFYAKTLSHGAELKTLDLVYVPATRATYDPLIPRLSSCFHDLAR